MDVYGRQDYFLSFESASDFYEWYYSAYDAYQAEHADDPVNDSSGGIDMGELLGDDT